MVRLAINGYGRIGRSILRALPESPYRDHLQVVAINELADASTVLHLTRYDSTHGRFPGQLGGDDKHLTVAGRDIALLREESIDDLPWGELEVDLVLECTGAFSDRATAEKHLVQGAGKVSTPRSSTASTSIPCRLDTALPLPAPARPMGLCRSSAPWPILWASRAVPLPQFTRR